MEQTDAYNNGYYEGTSTMYDVLMENPNIDIDTALNEVWEIEDNKRQYSPFEFFAKELNQSDYPDEVWDSYENGIGDGAIEIYNKLKK